MTIKQYEKRGFIGIDDNLETSLNEYGLIWKEFKYNLKKRQVAKGEYLFITPTNHGYFVPPVDITKEFEWIEWNNFLDFIGDNIDNFKNENFGYQMASLISYYGEANFLS